MITSRQNAIIKQFRKSGNNLTVEGTKLVTEALSAGFAPESALFTRASAEKYRNLFVNLSAQVISDDLAEYISDTKTPQGVFVKFSRKISEISDFNSSRMLVLLDGVRDPGNAGAIVRSCEAFGIDGVIFSDNSADIYNPKVVRASAGSAFRLPSLRGDLYGIISTLKDFGFTICGAALDKNAVSIEAFKKECKQAIVIGNEGEGISSSVLALCDYKIYIPIKGAESLNAAVAAGIICYELGG